MFCVTVNDSPSARAVAGRDSKRTWHAECGRADGSDAEVIARGKANDRVLVLDCGERKRINIEARVFLDRVDVDTGGRCASEKIREQ